LVCHCGPPSWSKPYFKVDPFNGGGSEHENGVVRIPDGPGLGIEIERAALEEFALKEADA
ncbi:hypothetical protein, partial [Chelativorans intermedius]